MRLSLLRVSLQDAANACLKRDAYNTLHPFFVNNFLRFSLLRLLIKRFNLWASCCPLVEEVRILQTSENYATPVLKKP